MIGRFDSQVGVQQRLASGLSAPTLGFDSHKDRINFGQEFRVARLEGPPAVGLIVDIKDAETDSLGTVRAFAGPCLENTGLANPRLLVQIEGVEDQGFASRIKEATE